MKKIIIIDDHPLVLAAMTSVISSVFSDIDILGAGSATEMRTMLDEAASTGDMPTLAFVDLNLPDANGIDLIPELYTQHRISVIAISGQTEPDRIRACIRNGAAGFIEKTSKMTVFPAAMQAVWSGGQYYPEGYMKSEHLETNAENPAYCLSVRQREVLDLLIEGKPNKLIADLLSLSEGTVKNHVRMLLQIFNVNSRSQLILATNKIGYRAKH